MKLFNRLLPDRYEEAEQKTPDRTIGMLMRKVLLEPPEGRYVLATLLQHWGYFRETTSIEEMVEKNVARELLWYMGIWHEDNILDILDKLKTVRPRWYNEKNDEQ